MFNFLRKKKPRVFVIGLDCAEPSLVFDKYCADLPNLRRLMQRGAYGRLQSCTPCITVPAWSVMTSSRDPGVLGIYGFRNRADYSYDRLTIANGNAVKEPRVWEILSQRGKQVVVVGVPGTYPPRPVNGALVGCFLTPSTVSTDAAGRKTSKVFTHPPELSETVNRWAGGEYIVDVKQFRTDDKDFLLRQIDEMTEQHFEVLRQLLRAEKGWDFFMFVEMGTDRIHHGFWKFVDPTHPKYEPGNRYENSIRDYYVRVDRQIGALLEMVDDGQTHLLVVSDHGAQKMDGGICVNEWMVREGLLALRDDPPARPTPMEKVDIDWSQTTAWGEGGYYARIFMNVKGREPNGLVEPADYERARDELAERIVGLRGPNGLDLGTQVYKPQAIYQKVNNVPPDLIVYWGDLYWRSVGTLGTPEVYTFENDTGPDDANHARNGLLIYSDPRKGLGGRLLHGLEIMDVAPTVLQLLGESVPASMQGRAINFNGS